MNNNPSGAFDLKSTVRSFKVGQFLVIESMPWHCSLDRSGRRIKVFQFMSSKRTWFSFDLLTPSYEYGSFVSMGTSNPNSPSTGER